jgi:hypothetical protein
MIRAASLVLTAVLVLVHLAEAAPAGTALKEVRRGDRVRLTLRSRAIFTGVVRSVTDERITLDLRWELGGAEGTMGFTPDLIRRVEVLAAWDDVELERRRQARIRRLKSVEEEIAQIAADREAARKAPPPAPAPSGAKSGGAPDAKPGAPAPVSPDDMKKGLEMLKEFPPKDGWGTASDKTVDWLRMKFPVIGVVLTPQEQKFVDNYDVWLKAKQAVESGAPVAPAPAAPTGAAPAPAAAAPQSAPAPK